MNKIIESAVKRIFGELIEIQSNFIIGNCYKCGQQKLEETKFLDFIEYQCSNCKRYWMEDDNGSN